MKTLTTQKTAAQYRETILDYLQAVGAGELVPVCDFLDLGDNRAEEQFIGQVLMGLRAEGLVTLVAASKRFVPDAEDLQRCRLATRLKGKTFTHLYLN